LFVAGSAAGALAHSVGSLIAARAVQGAGAAVMMPLALALLSAAAQPRAMHRTDRCGGERRGIETVEHLVRRSTELGAQQCSTAA
jgi:MFS family permease